MQLRSGDPGVLPEVPTSSTPGPEATLKSTSTPPRSAPEEERSMAVRVRFWPVRDDPGALTRRTGGAYPGAAVVIRSTTSTRLSASGAVTPPPHCPGGAVGRSPQTTSVPVACGWYPTEKVPAVSVRQDRS